METSGHKRTLLITGSTIGVALAEAYATEDTVERIVLTSRSGRHAGTHTKIDNRRLDVTEEKEVQELVTSLDRLDGVVNTIGLLHREDLQPEKSIRRLDPDRFMTSIQTNTLPSLLLAKHTAGLLRQSPQSFFAAISARVGSIEDNRLGGWYSYRMSKSALNMALKTLSIEWRHALPRCSVAALHPGTVASPLSEPFVKRRDTTIFTPEESAQYLKTILDSLTPEQSGRFWAWDGKEIAW